jgi:MFS transporter, UMF1 family
VRSSTEPGAELGPPDGDPVETAAAGAGGFAQWLNAREGVSAIGGTTASRLGQTSWAMFEWARNPYVLVIMIYLFAPFYAKTVVGDGVCGAHVPHDACGQSLAGWIQAGSGILIAILAPFLGAIADAGGRRKPWIALYVAILSVMMILMWYAKPHSTGWPLFFVSAVFALATVSYEFSAVFHNSLLPTLTTQKGIAGLSGLGLALGNAAGICLLLFLLVAFALPGVVHWPFLPAHPLFGLDHATYEPERLAGTVCAIWLIAFSSLLFMFTPDRPSSELGLFTAMREGVRSVIRTVKSLRHYRNVGAYLLARLFFNDGMTAVLTFGGIYAATTFHWGSIQLLLYGIELSIFAVAGGFVGGWLDNTFGSKRAIFISVGGTTLFGLLTLTMAPDRIFWFIRYDVHAPPVWSFRFFNTWPELIFLMVVNFIAVLITAGYANSRTMLARIAPVEKMTEFFGLYSLSGLSTTFLATGFVSLLTLLSHSQRIGLLGETLFLSIGLVLMFFVREERAAAA